jgi:hypothetical protein
MDPDGAEVGTADPWVAPLEPPTYENLKGEQPLYIEGGDPFDYSRGLTIDGLPVTQAEFNRRMRNGSAGGQVSIGGRPTAFVTNQELLTHTTVDVFAVDKELRGLPQSQRWGGTYYMGTFDVNWSRQQYAGRGGVSTNVDFFPNVFPQKLDEALVEDDPPVIEGESNTKNCSISVSFRKGTFYDGNPLLPNGPSAVLLKGQTSFGLGFTVFGAVSDGGIGHIGNQANPQNRTGTWTIDQWTSGWIARNGKQDPEGPGGPAWRDINTNIAFSAKSNTFSWYDHAGGLGWGIDRNNAFLVKVYRGDEYCQAEFHFVQRQRGPGYELHWGRGRWH